MMFINPISVVHARPIIPSRYMEALSEGKDENEDDSIKIGDNF